MSVVADASARVPRLDVELSPGCDHACAHCYNVWTARPGDPQAGYPTAGQLPTRALLAVLDKAVTQSGAESLTITGGEPLLRKDALDILDHLGARVRSLHLITNGSHVDAAVAARLKRAGVRSVQLTLLSQDRAAHDRLKGAVCFDDTVRAAVDLAEAGVAVQVCFVAMAENAGHLAGVLELCWVLGVRALSYNRMSPTGGAIHHVERLLPHVAQVEADLEVADRLGRRWGIAVSTAMPVPPCLVRTERYPHVTFGYCSTGTAAPNVVVDGRGNVRSCNLSSTVLGNLVEQDWAEIMAHPYPREFRRNVPAVCRGCAYEHTCNGGCKEAGFAATGDHTAPEPFMAQALAPRAGS